MSNTQQLVKTSKQHHGSKLVAEGIETDEQYAFVKNVGCDTAQGYGLGRPIPATEFLNQLAETEKVTREGAVTLHTPAKPTSQIATQMKTAV